MEELALKSEKKGKTSPILIYWQTVAKLWFFLVTSISSSPAQDQSVHQLLHQAPTFPRTVN